MTREQDIAVPQHRRIGSWARISFFTPRLIPFVSPATPAGSSDVARGGSAAGHGRPEAVA